MGSSRAQFRLESECSQVSMCPSCNENAYSEIAPELGPRRMTKYSLSENLLVPQISELQKQYSEIILSYHKLKISFTVMLVLNAILLVLVITCMVFIIPNITSKSEDKPNGEKTYVATPITGAIIRDPTSIDPVTTMVGRTVVDCQSIKEKLGKLYLKGQKVDNINGKTCSMEDFIDSFVQYIKTSKTEERTKGAFHLITNRNTLARCKDTARLKCLKNWEVKMNTTEIKANEGSIIVPMSGVYFIYNRVSVSIEDVNETMLGHIQHSMRHSNSGTNFKNIDSSDIECVVKNNRFSHVSYIEQVHFLEQGDEIRIALKMPPHLKMWSSSSFGMFQL